MERLLSALIKTKDCADNKFCGQTNMRLFSIEKHTFFYFPFFSERADGTIFFFLFFFPLQMVHGSSHNIYSSFQSSSFVYNIVMFAHEFDRLYYNQIQYHVF